MPSPFARLAFIDLETTGATATTDRITEIGIVEVSTTIDGTACETSVSEWSTLVNPGIAIPPFIVSLTGISDAMVADAPSFADVAQEIARRLDGCLFIAHNARFDHGFLKSEFRRLGIEFRPVVLCTVKLSRRLYPGFSRHNLDSLIERHRLIVTERHRALGDARLLWQFWQVILADATLDLDAAVAHLTARPTLPSHLDPGLVDLLPTSHGVYLFYGDNDLPLYIGKANDLRRRVLSHFSNDHRNPKDMELSQQVRRIDWIQTTGEIGALLKEAMLIKRMSPSYNQLLRKLDEPVSWRVIEQKSPPRKRRTRTIANDSGEDASMDWTGRAQIAIAHSHDLFFDQDDNLYGLFANARKAQGALRALVDMHGLCAVHLGLEKARPGKPCFAFQVKRCEGACTGAQSAAAHASRLREALAPWKLHAWPYEGPIGIREGRAMHVIDGWTYLGTAMGDSDLYDLLAPQRLLFDRDVYRIVKPRLERLARRIVNLVRSARDHGDVVQDWDQHEHHEPPEPPEPHEQHEQHQEHEAHEGHAGQEHYDLDHQHAQDTDMAFDET